MKKNFLIKSLSVFCIFTTFALQSIADDITNKLSEVIITPSDDYTYNLNLVFNDDFGGRAFMQTPKNGRYSIFIPDAQMAGKKVKIKNQAKKMPKIKVTVDEKPYVKDDIETFYLKLSVESNEDYSIKLVSQKAADKTPFENIMKILIFSLFTIASIVALIVYLMYNKKKNTNTFTVFPEQFTYNRRKKDTAAIDVEQTKTTNPADINKKFTTADKDTFGCFNLTQEEEKQKKANYRIQSSIKKMSVITNNLNKSSQTNPMSKTIMEDSSEFALPYVNDSLKETPAPEQEKEPPVLSILNLTPTKGFYLKEVEGEFCLFGFTGNSTFLLKKFQDLSQINLQARFYDQDSRSDIYIVRLDSYRAMIEISESGMKELAVL